jgi:hypothetical protein
MESLIDMEKLPVGARKALSSDAPLPLQMMAAKGVLPGAKPGDVLSVVAVLSRTGSDAVRPVAAKTLLGLPEAVLDGALGGELQTYVIDVLAEIHATRADIIERLLRQPAIGGKTLLLLGEQADEKIGELLATNETVLLANPQVIEALYMNRRVRMSTSDRLLELAVRHQLELSIPAYREAAQAIQQELIPEPSEEPTFDDLLFQEVETAAREVELADTEEDDTHDRDDDGNEQVRQKFLPLHFAITQMTITQKIRRAILGTAAERMLLVRDTNRLVATAAATSPQLTENDAARIAASRNVSDDVLRIIAQNRSFTRSYQVKLNLVTNPKTPFTFTARIIPHLRDNDLRALSKSKNVPATVQTAARQQMLRKQTKG